MSPPRFLKVFLGAATLAAVLAVGKALAFGGYRTLPQWKVLAFATSMFGLLAALIDWALLRDLLPLRRKQPISERGETAPPEPETVVKRAQSRPIVFREIFPPSSAKQALSFYGGVPIGPPNLAWPHCRNKPGEAPLSFVMQWNCTELAQQDETGLMPREGVLYLFADLAWGDPFDFEFIHAPGPVERFHPLPVPAGLPPVFGEDGAYQVPYCSPEISKTGPDVPRLLPKWPFAPVAFDLPASGAESPPLPWWDETALGETLLQVQHPAGDVPEPRRIDRAKRPFARPFAAFPHDYAAVRIVAATVLQGLHYPSTWLWRDRPEPERQAAFDQWRNDATQHYASAAQYEPRAKIEQSIADSIWPWMETLAPLLSVQWGELVELCVDTSLGLDSEAALPADLVAACATRHTLASAEIHHEYPDHSTPEALAAWNARKANGTLREVRSVHALTPNHMFGPPTFVQGYVEEYLEEWVLLLELRSNGSIGHYLGEGVLQFMIQPKNLQERRFDKVKLVASAY